MSHTIKTITLPSGGVLKVHVAPFADGRSLYQAVAEEVKSLRLDPKQDVDVMLYKELFCVAVSSKKIEAAIWQCMKKALINDAPVTEEYFEPVEKRDDYLQVCLEVTRENVAPFMKSLYAAYQPIFQMLLSDQAFKFLTNQS